MTSWIWSHLPELGLVLLLWLITGALVGSWIGQMIRQTEEAEPTGTEMFDR
jgi:hypothetical protein